MSDERWGYGSSNGSETWNGCYLTREEAVKDGAAYYFSREWGGPYPYFYVHSGHLVSVDSVLPDVDDLLERMGERADEEVGESADDYPSVTEEAKLELEELLRGWVEKYAKPDFWVADGVCECIPAPPSAPAMRRGEES